MLKTVTSSLLTLLVITAFFITIPETHAAQRERYKKTVEKYVIPDVVLVNHQGKRVKLRTLLSSRKVVMVDFIFTTCTTICPVLSAGFANFQNRMGEMKDVHLVSISIDPENDTPRRMREYLKRYDGKPGWDFLTGSKEDISKVLTALQAVTSDNKMYHLPLALLYSPGRDRWIRIYGLIGTSDLMAEYRELL